MTGIYILLGFLLTASGYIAWTLNHSRQEGDPRLKAEIERRTEEIGELKNQLTTLKSEKDELAGKGKQLYDNYKNIESDLKIAIKERDTLAARITKFEAHQEQLEKNMEEKFEKAESMREAFEDEKRRIRHEDEEREQREREERDRMWAEHENNIVSLLTDLCKKPQLSFTSFDNTNLPEGFHGTLKPDFMIEFLGQYVIFDAKVSKSENMQIYIRDQVKKTAGKVKGKQEKIYPTIFLVIPTDAITELKKLSYYEEGFSFFIVSPEALAPILASLKKIESYEFAQGMDPQERENVVDLVAQFDFHISSRNAVDFLLMQHGLETLAKTEQIDPELARDAAIKKAKMRSLAFNSAEHKQLAANPELLREKMQEFVKPKAQISQEELDQLKK